jgi:hypothetical protein
MGIIPLSERLLGLRVTAASQAHKPVCGLPPSPVGRFWQVQRPASICPKIVETHSIGPEYKAVRSPQWGGGKTVARTIELSLVR